ncbi:conserved hypothetical protein [Verticillium alfalfae VaMs.102]|uniref:Uncharacterized protein n=1 Tax=Verticillium alfalfae (strain VaMs.102 / ATCC MYA-4576 / FGSC 10136) TaxID=526221 RepID=C9SEF8_VERA1|nr:conserved hypothetical protein [Verticillium alfalfae VaMs.102]EEY16551.1 conserved hypothetical protein [Verticillium alfalfae VaMs.102]
MRFGTLTGAALAAASVSFAKEMPKDEARAAELYDSGKMHETIMGKKKAFWKSEIDSGMIDSSQWPRLNYTKCVDGKVAAIPGDPHHTFRCKNMDLYDFINHAELGSPSSDSQGRTGSSTWGWTDPESGREFIANGMFDGTSFIEILPEGKLLKLGFLELEGHGIQIFDMTKLLDITAANAPVEFTNEKDLTGHFADLPLGATHNVVVNEELEYGVAVGARPRNGGCFGGLIFFDLSDPTNPVKIGCDPQDGYTHDAQCLVYHGPDKKYEGRDICYGYNEDTLTMYDEYDVIGPARDGYPVTYIWDIRSLENPKNTGLYKGNVKSIDHNQYVKDGLVYQSNYGAGVRIYDVSSVPEDPSGNSVCEIACLDIYPEDDALPGGGSLEFVGSWASYALFDSGYIFINTIERGGFLAKMTKREACKPKSCNADNCLRALRSSNIEGRLEESREFCGEFTKTFVADVAVVPEYAVKACPTNIISRVSSACSCLPTSASS